MSALNFAPLSVLQGVELLSFLQRIRRTSNLPVALEADLVAQHFNPLWNTQYSRHELEAVIRTAGAYGATEAQPVGPGPLVVSPNLSR
jgi:hypothetical protein